MRILFIGGGVWGSAALKAAVDSGAAVVAIDTPRLDGRHKFPGGLFLRRLLHGNKILQSLYSIFNNGGNTFYQTLWRERIPVIVADSVNSRGFIRKARSYKPDLILVASCSEILGKEIIDIPSYGCINCHPSLLPKYRGPDPFYWVLKNKERETGVTLHFINDVIDAGDIILQKMIQVEPAETRESLILRSADLISDMVTEVLGSLRDGKIDSRKQDSVEATYYPAPGHSKQGALRIKEFGAKESGSWDQMIKDSLQYNFFSTSFWLNAVSEATKERYKMAACFYDGRPICGCSALLRRSLEGDLLTSAPLSQYSSILIFPQADGHRGALLALSRYLRSNSDWSILYMHPDFKETAVLRDDGWKSDERYTYYLDLSDPDKLYAEFNSALKRKIDKASDKDFRFSDTFEEFSAFYSLWADTFLRQGIKPPLSRRAFESIYNKIKHSGYSKTICAYDPKGTLASGVVFITDGDTAYYWASAMNREYTSFGINQCVLWKGLRWLSGVGTRTLDFVGADTPSIAAYKKHFGGRLVSHTRISYVSSTRAKAVRGIKGVYRRLFRARI